MLTLFCTQDATDASGTSLQHSATTLALAFRFCLSLKWDRRSFSAFTPLRPTPSCIPHTGHLGWPAVSPLQAGTLPGPGACRWWSRSSARHPLLTPRRHWSFDRTGQPSTPAEENTSVPESLSKNGMSEGSVWASIYLQQILLAQPIHGTAEVSFHRHYLCGRKQNDQVPFNSTLSGELQILQTYLVLPGCPVVLHWPLTGTPWGTSGPVWATAEPLWQSYAPGQHPSGLRAAQWTAGWGSCQGLTAASGKFSMWLRDRVTEWLELGGVSERYSTAGFRWSNIVATNHLLF